jgi:hypothetical protein
MGGKVDLFSDQLPHCRIVFHFSASCATGNYVHIIRIPRLEFHNCALSKQSRAANIQQQSQSKCAWELARTGS